MYFKRERRETFGRYLLLIVKRSQAGCLCCYFIKFIRNMFKLNKNTKSVHQFVPGLHIGDAITTDTLIIQKILRENGFSSEIYSNYKHTGEREKKIAHDFRKYKSDNPEALILYHYSTYSPITSFIREQNLKVILRYHNITPHEYFESINPDLADELKKGREDLSSIKENTTAGFSDSDFNSAELNALGFKNLHTLPIAFDFSRWEEMPDRDIMDLQKDKKGTIIFVGRIVPNKKQEDIIRAFYHYKEYINPEARLYLVGSYGSSMKYFNILRGLVNALQLDDVFFSGHISDKELFGYYKISDLFISLSEHEGFGVPLVEAMYYNLPIIALDRAAVKETLGDAGVVFKENNSRAIAEMIDLVMRDNVFREKIIKKQKSRLEYFSYKNQSARLLDLIKKLS